MDDARRTDETQGAPVCPRHPERVSRLTCRRCGRHACPECLQMTAEGMDCVECLDRPRWIPRAPSTSPAATSSAPVPGHDGASRSPQAEPVTPRVKVHEAAAPRPVVTYAIAALCVGVYLAQLVFPDLTDLASYYAVGGYVEPWRFLTAAFVHSPETFTHLLFNMMGLYVMGQFLEPFLGRTRFVVLYLLSALGGSVGYLLTIPTLDLSDRASSLPWAQSMVGASGAVFGLFAAAFLVLKRTGAPVAGMVVLLAINLALPFFYPNIAWQAHLGGAVAGLVTTAIMLATVRRPALHWSALGVVAAAMIVAAWVKYEVNARALDVLVPYVQH